MTKATKAAIVLLLISIVGVTLWLSGVFTPSVDCKTSDWSACDPTTGKKTRTVIVEAKNNGQACGALEEDCVFPFEAEDMFSTTPQEYVTIKYLDRHPRLCEDKAINRFQIVGTSPAHVKIDYKCSKNLITDKKTPGASNILDADRPSGLSRMPVVCGENEVLSNYGLVKTKDKNEYKLHYDCLKSKTDLTCREVTTGKSRYIAEHNIACDNDEAIGSLKVKDHGSDVINYIYTCCKKK